LFFPSSDPIASILATYLVFGVGFVMRPVGAILFGIYGDRYGRRRALSAVIFLMALSTLAIGLLPTYDEVGVVAPILLVLARLVQGLSAGGEWGGSTAYIVEYAPEGRRGFIGSWQQFSVGSGFLLGSLSGTVLSFALSPEALTSWGWRVPFLLGIVVGAVGAYLRWRLPDTPKYTEIEEHHEVAHAPFKEAVTKYPRETLTAFGITLHNTAAYYISLLYMTSYFITVGKLPQPTAQLIGTICLAVFVALIPFTGRLSDRIGRRPLLMASCIGYAILSYPLFMLGSSGSAPLAFLAQFVMIFFQSLYAGPCPAAYAELFPTRVRYTALSIGYNIAGRDLRRLRSLRRHLADPGNRQPARPGVLRDHRRRGHLRDPDADTRDRVRAAEVGFSPDAVQRPGNAYGLINCAGWRVMVWRPRLKAASGLRTSAIACSGVCASKITMSAGLPTLSP
jgi:MHS family proline/betaine transporter-like MFS transporter